jgi:hypothetical protein
MNIFLVFTTYAASNTVHLEQELKLVQASHAPRPVKEQTNGVPLSAGNLATVLKTRLTISVSLSCSEEEGYA